MKAPWVDFSVQLGTWFSDPTSDFSKDASDEDDVFCKFFLKDFWLLTYEAGLKWLRKVGILVGL